MHVEGDNMLIVDDKTDHKYSPRKQIVIIGAGGHATSVAEVAVSVGYEIKCFVDQNKAGLLLLNFPIISSFSDLDELENKAFAIAIGDNAVRERTFADLSSLLDISRFPPLVHRSANVSCFSSIGNGSVLMQGANVGANSIVKQFCILNTNCSVDHDSIIEDFSSIAPGAICGGTLKLGERSVISIGAVIKQGITIGADSVLGANSYLNKDLSSDSVAYGSPARVVRIRNKGEPYLS